MEENTNVDTGKYAGKLKADAGIVVLLLGILYFSESYIVYNILTTVWADVPEAATILPAYILFFVLLIGIETVGCLKVYGSIKEHMYTFEYYD
ncbi:hypothetical protein J2755_000707 [Methanohalophilus levihalophilus]|uniref:monomethylamine transporter n=1 Tax=Methanohalophilus levihalophilus TaxID=1431282 RepID=UPI001AEB4159|nr:monomethylamine transporter [Methanohalophilus levihalophilus]MBP2029787.1 hypothetical protein [Methanohalophilus levihalophilus]